MRASEKIVVLFSFAQKHESLEVFDFDPKNLFSGFKIFGPAVAGGAVTPSRCVEKIGPSDLGSRRTAHGGCES